MCPIGKNWRRFSPRSQRMLGRASNHSRKPSINYITLPLFGYYFLQHLADCYVYFLIKPAIVMKNALKYGLLIGIVSGAWIILMHVLGVYNQDKNERLI